MKRIWKFILSDDTDVCDIPMPKGAEVLKVGVTSKDHDQERDKLAVWAMVDPFAPIVNHKFSVVGTGWELSENLGKYLDSVQVFDGTWFVWHIFDLGEE